MIRILSYIGIFLCSALLVWVCGVCIVFFYFGVVVLVFGDVVRVYVVILVPLFG